MSDKERDNTTAEGTIAAGEIYNETKDCQDLLLAGNPIAS